MRNIRLELEIFHSNKKHHQNFEVPEVILRITIGNIIYYLVLAKGNLQNHSIRLKGSAKI